MKLPNFREASTKRGIVWIVGGGWIVYQAFRGNNVDSEALFNQLDFWLGVIMTVAGGFGLLPDETKPVNEELPPISLQGRSESGDAGARPQPVQPADQLRVSVPTDSRPGPTGTADPNTYPRFGSGFGDRD